MLTTLLVFCCHKWKRGIAYLTDESFYVLHELVLIFGHVKDRITAKL